MLKIILHRFQPQAEEVIAEEQAGYQAGKSTIELIFTFRVMGKKHLQYQQDLYHVFIDFKEASTGYGIYEKYNIKANLVYVIERLYDEVTSAVLFSGSAGKWFWTTVGVRPGCLISPTLFNIYLERIMTLTLVDHERNASIGSNIQFAEDIAGIIGEKNKLTRTGWLSWQNCQGLQNVNQAREAKSNDKQLR